jgi:WD40 repeat protein
MREELGMESFLAVGCADNSIVVVNVTTKTRVCTIAGLQVPYDRVVSLGRNPANGHAEVSLFKSNRGVLQKYNLDQDCQVSQLSVAYNQDQTPFVKARKGQKSSWAAGVGKSKEGTLLSYCADQQFLCTAEQYTNGMNIWLKFWSAKPNKKYEVEKTILNPHEQQITCILGHKQRSLVVTCSRDGKFKLWTREDNEWVCSCEASVPCLHVSTCCFSGKGDVFVASFGDNVGFWDIDNLSLMTVLKCPPSLGVKKFQSLSLMSEDKPAFMVGVWVSKDKKSKGITVWNLLNLKHLWSYRVQGGDCHVCCTSRSLSSSCKFAVSVTSEACKEDGTHSTKVLFFSPKSSEPEKVWHVSAYASDLFSIGNQVVIATREGNFISQDFATKVKDVVSQVTKDKSKLSKQYTLTSAPANGKDTTEKDSSAMDLDAVEFDSSSEFQGGLPKILSKYQNVPSHVLPPMSKLFEGLLQ